MKMSLVMSSNSGPRAVGTDGTDFRQKSHFQDGSKIKLVSCAPVPKYRRVCISGWKCIELLTSDDRFKGENLHIINGITEQSSALFHPHNLHSLIIQNCTSVGPIVAGTVNEFVLLKNVHNTKVSVIAPRIRLENCSKVTLFNNTEMPILLNGDCWGIILAPYNVINDVSICY